MTSQILHVKIKHGVARLATSMYCFALRIYKEPIKIQEVMPDLLVWSRSWRKNRRLHWSENIVLKVDDWEHVAIL